MQRRHQLKTAIFLWTIILSFAASSWISASEDRENWATRAYKKNVNAVVNIQGDKVDEFGGDGKNGESGKSYNGMGTGVIIDERGYIVTNYHVVQGIRKIQVTTFDRSKFTATLVARDTETDLAIIKITPKEPLQTMTLGRSDDVMPGEFCMVIGNPYGYPFKATHGLISGVGEEVVVTDELTYRNAIQISSPINPGNSGGPLFNVNGEMIGINAAIRQGAECIAFAIPVDQIVDVSSRLIANAESRFAYLGLQVYQTDSDSDVAKNAGISADEPRRSIVVVESVDANSPAAAAGIKVGDIITGAGKYSVSNKIDFSRALIGRKSNDDLGFNILREQEKLDIALTLAAPQDDSFARNGSRRQLAGSGPNAANATGSAKVANQAKPGDDNVWEALGLRYTPLTKEEYQRNYAQFVNDYPYGGVTVKAVKEDSAMNDKGVSPGDVIIGIHEWVATSTNDMRFIAKAWPTLNPTSGTVRVLILREGVLYSTDVPVKKK